MNMKHQVLMNPRIDPKCHCWFELRKCECAIVVPINAWSKVNRVLTTSTEFSGGLACPFTSGYFPLPCLLFVKFNHSIRSKNNAQHIQSNPDSSPYHKQTPWLEVYLCGDGPVWDPIFDQSAFAPHMAPSLSAPGRSYPVDLQCMSKILTAVK